MKSVFLAGGKGTRLAPLTDNLPKPMVPILGVPHLHRMLDGLKDAGINEAIFCTCHVPEAITSYFGDGSHLGLSIKYVNEDVPLGTGGAIRNAADGLKESFLIFNSDILADIDYQQLLKHHYSKHADVTIVGTWVADPTPYGVIEYDEHGYIKQFIEKPEKEHVRSNYINAGVYVFEPRVLKEIAEGRPVSVEKEVFPLLLERGYKLSVFLSQGYWIDIGTPDKYIQCHKDVLAGKFRPKGMVLPNKRSAFGMAKHAMHPVHLDKAVHIGQDVQIGQGTIIGPNCVIGDGSVIGEFASLSNCIIWNGVNIGKRVIARNSVIGSNVVINDNGVVSGRLLTTDL